MSIYILPEQLTALLNGGQFTLLKDRRDGGQRQVVLSAPPQEWEAAGLPLQSTTLLPLEDIFIAIAGETIAEL